MLPEVLHTSIDSEPIAPPRWEGTGACAGVDPELFFPLDEDGAGAAPARAVCAGCPVRVLCLDYALRTGMPAGVWGGLSTSEREALIRARHVTVRSTR